ncbi:flagellar protein FlgN [Halomonas organivorans]
MSLERLLEEQVGRLNELRGLLEEEQGLLVAGEVDGKRLQTIAEEKTRLQAAIESTETLRAKVQGRLGYAEGLEGAGKAAEDAGCLVHWETLLASAAEISRLNERNGRLLELRMSHNQQMLDYIHRLADPDVYAANGRTGLQPRRLNARA